MKTKKGISLIVLIITIVVIIILATAIILNIANTNLIGSSKAAVFKSDVSAMQDELTMYISDEFINEQGKYDSKKLQATEEGIWYGSTQLEGTITDIITSMDEKYVGKIFIQDGKLVANKMLVTVEEEKWLNDLGIMSTTQTDIGILNITPSTKDWTNGNVEVEINYTKEIPAGYAIEYKINNGSWQEGIRVVVEENNTKVTARLYSKEKDNEALSNSYTVSKIDKEVPDITNMKIDITAGTNTITAIASGATDSLSGLAKYQYSIDGIVWQDSGVFNGYKNATEVTVYTKAIDKVGNESESISNTGTTTSITAPTLNLLNNEWTRNDVVASVTGTAPAGYALEYKLSGGMTLDWTTYTGNVTITENNTTMVARYYNKDVDDEIASPSKTASMIDKFAPDITAMKITLTATENSITATASGATDALSGNVTYKYSLDNSTWQTSGIFSGIKSGTATTVYAKAIDKVGNESASISNKGTTSSITGTVAITQSPAAGTWTAGNVTVTLSYANIPSGYVMQYKLGTGVWTAYSSALTISTNNTTVSARLYNASVDDEVASSSKTISNIDKFAPDITAMKITLTATTNSITATASGATDENDFVYEYSTDNANWKENGEFTGLTAGTQYTVYARAKDEAGNKSNAIDKKISTKYNQIAVNTPVENENATVYGEKPAYNNPVIPVGFKAINTTDATWSDTNSDGLPDGWNNGLVIQDASLNEFVWVPCTTDTNDTTNIQYTKRFNEYPKYSSITSVSDDVDALPTGITNETAQITKYGGFYIGRYEAGVPANQTTIDGKYGDGSTSKSDADGIPVVKKDAIVWTQISYNKAMPNAKSFINTANVKSGLLTGTAWDTVCAWIQSETDSDGKVVHDVINDSKSWGNHSNDPVDGNNGKKTAGFKEEWKAKNIYDFAGNTWEWTGENCSATRIYRGGIYCYTGSKCPASYRGNFKPYVTEVDLSFRLMLYVM